MLEQLARHGHLDLSVNVKGDLHIDEASHHRRHCTALGESFAKALGTREESNAMGFTLPME